MTADFEREAALNVLTFARSLIKGSNPSLLPDDGLEQLLDTAMREEDFDLVPFEIEPTVVKEGENAGRSWHGSGGGCFA